MLRTTPHRVADGQLSLFASDGAFAPSALVGAVRVAVPAAAPDVPDDPDGRAVCVALSTPSLEEDPMAPLTALARRGDHAAYAALVQQLAPGFYRHALRLVRSPDVAEDIVQDAFVRAHRHLDRLAGRFDAWAFRIVTNLCKDWLKDIRQRHESYDEASGDALRSMRAGPDTETERAALGDALNAAITKLCDHHREAFLLVHSRGHSYEELAQILEISVGAAKMRVHRARERLQVLLRETYEDYCAA